MAAEQLVDSEIQAAKQLITALDEAEFDVIAALWVYSSDADRWRFVVAYDGSRAEIQTRYQQAARILFDWRRAHPGNPVLDLDRVRIVSREDPLVKGLGMVMRVESGDLRFSHNMINGVYVEDALIHRLAA